MDSPKLPEFARPPVVETVLGVHFEEFGQFRNAHLGAFWKTLPVGWTSVADAAPMPQQVEVFDGSKLGGRNLSVVFTNQPDLRLQIRNAADNRMVQLQNGQLYYNWLGHEGEECARYPAIRKEFDDVLARFERFAKDESLGELKPLQWEVTYVNQFPKGTVWSSPADWRELFVSLPATSPGPAGTRLESFGGEWHYEIGDKRGRLHVKATHGRRAKPHHDEALTLTLTARGPVDASEPNPIGIGLDLGRETIVRAFRDLTSDAAHKFWGLKNA
jgi:uncharacterized protein (TIGR04255 family)